jgi:hypothetical protein
MMDAEANNLSHSLFDRRRDLVGEQVREKRKERALAEQGALERNHKKS